MDLKRKTDLENYPQPKPVGELDSYIKLFLFGDHGAWKTVTSCQVGSHRGRVLLMHTEDDWKSLKNHPEIAANVEPVPMQDPYHAKLISEALRDQVSPYNQYATFVFDTVGGWADEFIEILLSDVAYSDRNSRSRVSGIGNRGERFVKQMNLVTPELTDYNLAKIQLRPIVNNLIKAPVNVVFIAHNRNVEKDEKKKFNSWAHIRPDLPEGCFNVLARKCDALGFMEKQSGGRPPKISFKLGRDITTKTRLGVFSNQEFPAPDAVNFINKWLEEE